EVLGIISRSPTDVQPVLDAIVESAARVCGIDDVVLRFLEGDSMVPRAHFGPRPVGPVRSIDAPLVGWIREHGTLHIPDVRAQNDFPTIGSGSGARTFLSVPLRQQGELIGLMTVRRTEVRPFTPAQIKLLETFSDQAVIAIENVRLFRELQEKNQALTKAHAQVNEALERQTATSEILSVIASSPTDVQPVYDAIVRSAVTLCEATLATVYRREGDLVHLVGIQHQHPYAADVAAAYPAPVTSALMSCRAILENAVIHLPDVDAEGALPPEGLRLARLSDFRSVLSVPMRREGHSIGAILIGRPVRGLFPDEQVALLQTFADQAVIAIENVRLFKELEARNHDLTE